MIMGTDPDAESFATLHLQGKKAGSMPLEKNESAAAALLFHRERAFKSPFPLTLCLLE